MSTHTLTNNSDIQNDNQILYSFILCCRILNMFFFLFASNLCECIWCSPQYAESEKKCVLCYSSVAQTVFNLLAAELFFFILAHPVHKM